MKGGVAFYRGSGKEARHYIESDHHKLGRADEYYLAEGEGIAEMTRVTNGAVTERVALDGDAYEAWVEGKDPRTGMPKGNVAKGGDDRAALRFCEVNINAPKSLSIAAAFHPDISAALDAAQAAAAEQVTAILAEHVTTRIGPRGGQVQVHVDEIEVVSVVHQSSRAGDPHRHIHHQLNARVLVAGEYRGLDSKAMLRMTRMVNGVGARATLAHPELRAALAAHGYTLTRGGEIEQLAKYVPAMSKRATQVGRNIDRYEREWRKANPGQEPGRVLQGTWKRGAWNDGRQAKNKARLAMPGHLVDQEWRAELEALGVDIDALQSAGPAAVQGPMPGEVDRESVAKRSLAVLGAGANGRSTWNVYDVRGAVEETLAKLLVHGDAAALNELAEDIAARVAVHCPSTDPARVQLPDHIRHLTSNAVIGLERDIDGRLAVRAAQGHETYAGAVLGDLDVGQVEAVRALAGTGAVVMVEGAAGTGKTTMLGEATRLLAEQGCTLQVVAPSRKAATVAAEEIGAEDANTVHGLAYRYGFRWDAEGVWTRLGVGDTDSKGTVFQGPSDHAKLTSRHMVVVDEAGMLDQECARALLHVADEAGVRLGFVGDRPQLDAVGRGGVLDKVAAWSPAMVEMSAVHRFRMNVEVEPGRIESVPDTEYADLSLQMRSGQNPGEVFDKLVERGQVELHPTEVAATEAIAERSADLIEANATLPKAKKVSEAVAVGTNAEAEQINAAVRQRLISAGLVSDTVTVTGADGIRIGKGDRVQTRTNDRDLDVLNRETWTVRDVTDAGQVRLQNERNGRFSEVGRDYCLDAVQHAWASTVHGVQGATADRGTLLMSAGTDAAGEYVPMTRGMYDNTLHIVAGSVADARQQWIDGANRNRADIGLDHATAGAKLEAAEYQEIDPAVAERMRVSQERIRAGAAERKARKAQAAAQGQQEQRRPYQSTELYHQPAPRQGLHL